MAIFQPIESTFVQRYNPLPLEGIAQAGAQLQERSMQTQDMMGQIYDNIAEASVHDADLGNFMMDQQMVQNSLNQIAQEGNLFEAQGKVQQVAAQMQQNIGLYEREQENVNATLESLDNSDMQDWMKNRYRDIVLSRSGLSRTENGQLDPQSLSRVRTFGDTEQPFEAAVRAVNLLKDRINETISDDGTVRTKEYVGGVSRERALAASMEAMGLAYDRDGNIVSHDGAMSNEVGNYFNYKAELLADKFVREGLDPQEASQRAQNTVLMERKRIAQSAANTYSSEKHRYERTLRTPSEREGADIGGSVNSNAGTLPSKVRTRNDYVEGSTARIEYDSIALEQSRSMFEDPDAHNLNFESFDRYKQVHDRVQEAARNMPPNATAEDLYMEVFGENEEVKNAYLADTAILEGSADHVAARAQVDIIPTLDLANADQIEGNMLDVLGRILESGGAVSPDVSNAAIDNNRGILTDPELVSLSTFNPSRQSVTLKVNEKSPTSIFNPWGLFGRDFKAGDYIEIDLQDDQWRGFVDQYSTLLVDEDPAITRSIMEEMDASSNIVRATSGFNGQEELPTVTRNLGSREGGNNIEQAEGVEGFDIKGAFNIDDERFYFQYDTPQGTQNITYGDVAIATGYNVNSADISQHIQGMSAARVQDAINLIKNMRTGADLTAEQLSQTGLTERDISDVIDVLQSQPARFETKGRGLSVARQIQTARVR
jgi:hypothetical protein